MSASTAPKSEPPASPPSSRPVPTSCRGSEPCPPTVPDRALLPLLMDLVDHVPVALAVYDASGNCAYTNTAMADLMGTAMRTWKKRSLWEVVPWRDAGIVRDAMLTLTDGQERHRPFEPAHHQGRREATVRRLPFGEDDFVAVIASPVSDSARPVGSATTDDLARFAAATAHRVNNGLVPANCALDMLAERHGDSKVSRMLLAQARQAIGRVSQGVNAAVDVLTTSAKRANDELCFAEVFAGLDRERPAAEAARLALPGADFDALPVVRGCAASVREALQKLIDNALEACAAGTVRVEVRERHIVSSHQVCSGDTLAPGCYVVIEVADDGPGFPPATRGRASLPFFSTKGLGRGLGLATAARIAREHGGGIDSRTCSDGANRVSLWIAADITES